MKAQRSPMRWRGTSCLRSITCRKRRRRNNYLIRIFFKNRRDRAFPRAVEFLQQFLCRRDAARNALFERTQVSSLVAAIAVEVPAARQPARGEPQRLLRQCEHIAAANLRVEAELRHVVAQPLALR